MTLIGGSRRVGRAVAMVVISVLPAACGSSTPGASVHTSSAAARPSSGSATVWLCRPGLARDPCTADEDATVVRANGSTTIERSAPAKALPIDCFYVYPTVSTT